MRPQKYSKGNKNKEIRDKWIKTKFANQWGLSAHYWKMALDEAISNIKTQWANTKLRIKKAVFKNENLTEDERHFILYILKADNLLYNILKHKPIKTSQKIENLIIREKYIYNLVRRYIRKYKGKVPYSYNHRSFMIDADMYKYTKINNDLFIEITGLKPRKRIKIRLKDKNIHKGNLRIILNDDFIEIHRPKQIKVKQNWKEEKTIGIDKGYRTLIATSENKLYGENLNEILSKETERLNNKNAERNKYYALYNKYQNEGKTKKAENILKNNLGKKKYNKHKNRHDSTVKSYINHEISKFIDNDKPSEIVIEDLTFVSWKNRFPRHIKRKLSRWIKGYINERINYKAGLNNIKVTTVNSAYTSKICNRCKTFGTRNNDIFECPRCGKLHADNNAADNIKDRKYDKEINLCPFTLAQPRLHTYTV